MCEFNFKSQAGTTLEQSKRLFALGLKKETADMHYWKGVSGTWYLDAKPYDDAEEDNIPAWSLHRLIEMMPKKVITPTKGHYYRVLYNNSIGYEIGDYSIARFFGENLYDKIISCIEWLIKEGHFNKEYLV